MIDSVGAALRAVRERRSRRWAALAVGTVGGLAAATVHPLGLLLGGAMVGVASRTLPRALAAGLGFGVVALAVFAVTLPGSPARVLALTPISYVGIAIGLVAPLVGSLARGIA